ncbi:MAG: YczE/YyaS/YitT family protein, partial [Marmoricola sp.]
MSFRADARIPTAPARELARLGPVEQLRAGRLTRRLTQLIGGLVLYGLTLAMIIRGTLGNAPWDVLHQGLADHLPIDIGTALIVVSFVVLLLWIPIRELPGLGTIANAVLIGLAADVFLALIAEPDALAARVALTVAGVALNGLATALYIGSQLGPGPRDGLMTGLHRRTGVSVRLVRTGLEVTVVVIGFFLGGTVGPGTLLYALAIGPMVQLFLPYAIVELAVVEVPRSEARAQWPRNPVTDP